MPRPSTTGPSPISISPETGPLAVNPAAFLIDTGSIPLPAGRAAGDPLWVSGYTTPFGTAPPDFNAVAVNNETSVQIAGGQVGGGAPTTPGNGIAESAVRYATRRSCRSPGRAARRRLRPVPKRVFRSASAYVRTARQDRSPNHRLDDGPAITVAPTDSERDEHICSAVLGR